MAWNDVPFREHFAEITQQLNRQAFWKTALFGVLLLERQWPVYERLSTGRIWGAAKEVRQVLDRLWKGVPTGMRLDDKYLLMLEENPVEPPEEPWDCVAACMITDSLTLLHTFRRKDKKAAGMLAEQNLQCLNLFLETCGENCIPTHPLVAAELAFQRELCQWLCQVPNKEKAAAIARCREKKTGSVLGNQWFSNYPDYKPLKQRRKKLPLLRYTHARYDDYVEKLKQRDEQGRDAWDLNRAKLEAYDTWLNWSHQMPDDCNIRHPAIQHAVHRWPMPDSLAEIYDYFALSIGLDARAGWACTEDPELVRGMFWLCARAQEGCYALLEKGWPCSVYLSHENSMHKCLTGSAFDAICAGDWVLAEHILKRWHNPLTLRGKLAPWRRVPATRVWLALIQGDDEQACFLMEKENEGKRPPTEEEKLWPHLYPWNSWDEDCEIFHMLLNRDGKGLEKEIIGNIRSLRGQYEFDLVTLSSYNLALWKLARRRGMELDLPPVSEMPAALLEDKPLDAEKWKLPGQAVLDAALGVQGMDLLAKWTQFSENDSHSS